MQSIRINKPWDATVNIEEATTDMLPYITCITKKHRSVSINKQTKLVDGFNLAETIGRCMKMYDVF